MLKGFLLTIAIIIAIALGLWLLQDVIKELATILVFVLGIGFFSLIDKNS